jgi:uncharacterized protein YdcH (DUF465 family)
LTELVRHRTLTPQEELHKKALQKQKLAIKDRMAMLMQACRSGFARRRSHAAPPSGAV